jgi:hypothetical protein
MFDVNDKEFGAQCGNDTVGKDFLLWLNLRCELTCLTDTPFDLLQQLI